VNHGPFTRKERIIHWTNGKLNYIANLVISSTGEWTGLKITVAAGRTRDGTYWIEIMTHRVANPSSKDDLAHPSPRTSHDIT